MAAETGDVMPVKKQLRRCGNLLRLSKDTYCKMVQNLAWATGYNVVAIPLADGMLYT